MTISDTLPAVNSRRAAASSTVDAYVEQLLIREARRKMLRRRLRFMAAVLVALGAVVAIWQDGGGTHPSLPSRVHTPSPGRGSPNGTSNLSALAVLGGQSLIQVVPFGSSTLWVSTANEVKLTGGGQGIELTTNSGGTWTNVTPPGMSVTGGSHWINGFFALSPTRAWLVSGGVEVGPQVIQTTSDAGRHWSKVGVLPDLGCTLQFVSARNGTCTDAVGAAGSMPIGIYRTSNGGANWHKIFQSSVSTTSNTPGSIPFGCDKIVHFASATRGFVLFWCAGGTGAFIYETTNGGVTWAERNVTQPKIPVGGGGFTSPPVFVGLRGAVAYGGGSYSAVFVTDNGGQSFHPVYPPGRPRQWAVDIISPSLWRLTYGKEILATNDGGTSWFSVRSGTVLRVTSSWREGESTGGLVEFSTPTDGWLTENTAISTLLRTNDGGRNWHRVKVPGI